MLSMTCKQTGVLQPKNRMDIEALLNPAEESWMMDGMTDEGYVRLCWCKRCSGRRPINGGDDDIEDDATT